MFLHLLNTLIILFSLISYPTRYVNPNAHKKPHDSNSVRYNIGRFDLETWACELQNQKGAEMVWNDYGAQCRIEMAGRAMMIPFLVVGVLVAGMSVNELVGGKRIEEQKSWDKQTKVADEEREVEMSRFNAI
jgi:hypothetical protein